MLNKNKGINCFLQAVGDECEIVLLSMSRWVLRNKEGLKVFDNFVVEAFGIPEEFDLTIIGIIKEFIWEYIIQWNVEIDELMGVRQKLFGVMQPI